MDMGAVLITAGCGDAPALSCGSICCAQRMIASLKKAGAHTIAVVTGPEDKKLEKLLAQPGVFFLHNPAPQRQETSVQMGISYLADKCRRIFLLQADRPLLAPDTLLKLMAVDADLVIPSHGGSLGQPLLLRKPFAVSGTMEALSLQQATVVEVEDPGILLGAREAASMPDAISAHDRELTRPVLDFSVVRDKPVLDSKLVTLLRLIRETQSVRDACSRMQISYSTAWNLLNTAEDSLGYPLILRNKGGPSGSGSLLTEKGSALLAASEQFEAAARKKLEALYESCFGGLL